VSFFIYRRFSVTRPGENNPLARLRKGIAEAGDTPLGAARYGAYLDALISSGEVDAFDQLQAAEAQAQPEIEQAVVEINRDIVFLREAGHPVMIDVDDIPLFRVVSFDPPHFVPYENGKDPEAARLAGSFALNLLITDPIQGGASIAYYTVDRERDTLGFEIASMEQLESIAQAAGMPEV
jgi:hypothetical protein